MKRAYLALSILISICLLSCVQGKETKAKDTRGNDIVTFDLSRYHNPTLLTSKKDSSLAFINLLSKEDLKGAERIYPKMFSLDITSGVVTVEGEQPMLVGLGEYVLDYSKNTYELLALSVFLKKKHNTRLELYDQMLRGSIRLDSSNVAAFYLLSEVRHKYGVKEDAYYLISKMKELDTESPEIDRLYRSHDSIIKNLGSGLKSMIPDFLIISVVEH